MTIGIGAAGPGAGRAVFAALAAVEDAVLGRTRFEPNAVIEDGRIVAINGRTSARISYA